MKDEKIGVGAGGAGSNHDGLQATFQIGAEVEAAKWLESNTVTNSITQQTALQILSDSKSAPSWRSATKSMGPAVTTNESDASGVALHGISPSPAPSNDSVQDGTGNCGDGSRVGTVAETPISAFRQSLDAEAAVKKAALQPHTAGRNPAQQQQQQQQQQEPQTPHPNAPQRLLSNSLSSLSGRVDGHGQLLLTTPERAFLERLARTDGPESAEACTVAHQRLTDGSLFGMGACGVTCLGLGEMTGDNWVQEWVSRGSQSKSQESSRGSSGQRSDDDGQRKKGASPRTGVPPAEDRVDLTPRRQSSEARLTRLEHRRRQSSVGSRRDCPTNRLFRAHEVGLVVTPGGSARRSLMRMGLPMERGLYRDAAAAAPGNGSAAAEPPPPSVEDACVENVAPPPSSLAAPGAPGRTRTGSGSLAADVEPTAFEKALAKMDERTIRRLEKEGRAKRGCDRPEAGEDGRQLVWASAPNNVGCISPFSMSILRQMFASKQISFHGRQGSSWNRFDSFLTADTTESGLLSNATAGADTMAGRKEVFRPVPQARRASSGERLANLLANAGFKREAGLSREGGRAAPVWTPRLPLPGRPDSHTLSLSYRYRCMYR